MVDNYLTNKPCDVCGRNRRRKSRRYCSHACYQSDRKPADPATRFWSSVHKTDNCWIWQRSTKKKGYGQFLLSTNRVVLAHRYAWELTNGAIPAGLSVLHRCDNPPCVNPSHLFLGTRAENSEDMIRKGRDRKRGLRGAMNHRAKLTDDAVRIIRHQRALGVGLAPLAHRFNVSTYAIWAVVKRLTWIDVE